MDMRFGTWNVRNLYRAGSFTAEGKELARYKLDLVDVQAVRWYKRGTLKAGDYSVDKKNQLDVTFCILYFSSNSCSTCFGHPCAHHQELTTA